MKLDSSDRERRALSPDAMAAAVSELRVNGYVVLEAVFEPELTRWLRDDFVRVLDAHTRENAANRGTMRYQMHLPFRAPFTDAGIVTNSFALPIIDHMLSEDCVCHYFASDTPLPGSDYQAAHSDIHPLFPETQLVVPPYCIVLNVPLVNVNDDNGPLEIWRGTHLVGGRPDVARLAEGIAAERVQMPAGSILLRDMRTWHRGTPNRSAAARPALALIYARHWLKTQYRPIPIPKATYDALSARAQRLFRQEAISAS